MKISEVIVVEGKTDVNKLSQIVNADFIITNGTHLDSKVISLIEVVKDRGLIFFFDPDTPGEKIRKELTRLYPQAKHAFIEKKYAIKGHKVGVAETDNEHLLKALENLVTFSNQKETLSFTDLYELKLTGSNSQKKREVLGIKLHIGFCNSKTFLKRCNMLGITKEQLNEYQK
ncbi:MAG: ribonuclease M5 [Bacillales bacterium]|nr:ribonuclease M5 [Bacillales bacterium]